MGSGEPEPRRGGGGGATVGGGSESPLQVASGDQSEPVLLNSEELEASGTAPLAKVAQGESGIPANFGQDGMGSIPATPQHYLPLLRFQ